MALTDHDTVEGCEPTAGECAASGIEFIPGTELTAEQDGREIHLLGYCVDIHNAKLLAEIKKFQSVRQDRIREMVARLNRIEVPLETEAVFALANCRSPGRPHVARALVEQGAVSDLNEAFTRYLGRGRPAYVEKPLPTLAQVTELVHAVGGIAVAAHLGDRGSEGQVRQFKEQGLDGLEVRHPSHDAGTEARLTRIADRLGLGISGGSDWHGDTELGNTHAPLGGIDVPLEWLERLEARRT
jgi:predicted metal-dependent phosphoesterase TrpH